MILGGTSRHLVEVKGWSLWMIAKSLRSQRLVGFSIVLWNDMYLCRVLPLLGNQLVEFCAPSVVVAAAFSSVLFSSGIDR